MRKDDGPAADPDTLSAWGLVHRGMAVSWSNFNSASNLRAEHFYRRATEVAPEDARAHAFLANNLAMKVINGWTLDSRRPVIDEARKHGQIALDLDPQDPIVLGQLGHMNTCLLDPDTALRLFQRSIDIDPNGVFSLAMRSMALTALGRASEAIDAVQDALRRSPRDPSVNWYLSLLSWAYLQIEDFDEAAEQARQAIVHYNGWQPSWIGLAIALAALGDLDKAREAADYGRRLAPETILGGYQEFFKYLSRDPAQGDRCADLLQQIWV